MLLQRLPIILALSLALSLPCLAQDFKLTLEEASLPDDVSPAIQETVSKEAAIVASGDQVIARFWLVPDVPASDNPSTELGVTFGSIKTGTFVGVVQIEGKWSDYKENPISPGVYTLRYGVMPADGNHMGVSVYRDYLMLVPAGNDQDPAQTLGYDQLVESSMDATGVPHPAVLALFPIWDEVAEPQLVQNELGQSTLAVKLGDKTVGLVVKGHGEG